MKGGPSGTGRETADDESEQLGESAMGDQPNILFVDDEDSIRLTLPPLLQSYGFEVTSAATVAEALDLITRHKFDVLISDLNIGHPGDGFTVVSAMRGKELTADNRKAYVRHGAIRYRQGYTVPLLIREARLLQASLADCIQRNFTAIEMNYLVPDTIHFMGTIDALLEDSARGFIQQANSERASRSRRKGGKKVAESDAEAS